MMDLLGLLKELEKEDIKKLLCRALGDMERGMGAYEGMIDEDALDFLAEMSGGDARNALNALELRALKKSDSKKKELGFFRVGIIIEIWEGGLRNAERSFTVETTIITLSGDLRCDYSRQSSSAENEREYRF